NAMNSRLRSIFRRAAKSTVRSGFSRTKAEKPGPEIATSLMGRSCGLPNTWTGEVRRTDAVGQGSSRGGIGKGALPGRPGRSRGGRRGRETESAAPLYFPHEFAITVLYGHVLG